MSLQDQPIYHLVPQSYYQAQPQDQPYLPNLFSQEGFIHCTAGVEMLLQVANAFFADLLEPLMALELDSDRLTAPLKFEPPASPKLVDSDFTPAPNILFPHIYGPLNRGAIKRTITLQRSLSGRWQMP